MTWLAVRAFLGGVPKWAWYALAGVLLAAAFLWWLALEKQAAVEANRSAARAEAVSRAREADERAETAANRKSQEVEDGNDRAREAAAGSDDPLGDALRSLRPAED